MENNKDRLDMNEIRCPYCRNKQNLLLPLYEIPGVKTIPGINTEYIKIYPEGYITNNRCCFKTIFHYQTIANGKQINHEQSKQCFACYNIYKLPEKYQEKDANIYCKKHIKLITKKYDKEEKEQIKKDKLLEKEKAKELKNQEKIEKQKSKPKPKTIKQTTNKPATNQTNEILDENIVIEQNPMLCKSILKTGLNKGKQCSLKHCYDGYCKRHSNMAKTIETETNETDSIKIQTK